MLKVEDVPSYSRTSLTHFKQFSEVQHWSLKSGLFHFKQIFFFFGGEEREREESNDLASTLSSTTSKA